MAGPRLPGADPFEVLFNTEQTETEHANLTYEDGSGPTILGNVAWHDFVAR